MMEIERRMQHDRRRATRNGRRVTDPATPIVGNQPGPQQSSQERVLESEQASVDTASTSVLDTSTVAARGQQAVPTDT